ncbi:receptor-type tyrosine-protein phosphatase C isoform X3 [Hoplias malabaricus]|uniref:receptor-type tyrosine-protein phosphatase C isoform X3 n=1 Tax=Hoplias malabaricus TaxID=27720 RepID=UPI0034635B93
MATFWRLSFLVLILAALAVCSGAQGNGIQLSPTQSSTVTTSPTTASSISNEGNALALSSTQSPAIIIKPSTASPDGNKDTSGISTSTESKKTTASPTRISPQLDKSENEPQTPSSHPAPKEKEEKRKEMEEESDPQTPSSHPAPKEKEEKRKEMEDGNENEPQTPSSHPAPKEKEEKRKEMEEDTSGISTSTESKKTTASPTRISPQLDKSESEPQTPSSHPAPKEKEEKGKEMEEDTSSSISPLTKSNVTTALPTTTAANISTTATPMPTCNYTIQPGKKETFAFEVKFNRQQNYSFTYTDNSISTTLLFNEVNLKAIRFDMLKPCLNYTVIVTPDCDGDRSFETKEFDENDITCMKRTNNSIQLETKWNVTEDYDITDNKICDLKPLNISCQKKTKVIVPPENLVINFTNWMPPVLYWENKPADHCPNLTINCTSKDSNFSVQSGSIVKKHFESNHIYNCTGIWNHNKSLIMSKGLLVQITCDVRETIRFTQADTSIEAIWDVKEGCTTKGFYSEVTCKNFTETFLQVLKEVKCSLKPSKKSCTMTSLKPFTTYKCDFKIKYESQTNHEYNETLQTHPGIPEMNKPTVTSQHSHNAFKVQCKINQWHGKRGNVTVRISSGSHERKMNKQCDPNCDFDFDNLYYSSVYEVEVFAINGNENKSETYIIKYTTSYNDKAVLGFLGFLIALTSIALLFVLYKIFLLKRKQTRDEREMDDLLPTNTLLPVEPIAADALVETYKKKIADEGRLFMEEFQSIPRIFSNYTVKEAKKAENQSKNRYVDILPYDYNRVQLTSGGRHDYINASFIEGYKESNKYIAAQGPKEETVEDFWRMIWEQQTSIIVMVTRCEEGNKNKCAQYWPSVERETEIYDDFVVKIKGEENCPDYIIRRLTLMNRKEKTVERDVTHIQFTSWPDHGVPGDPGLLLKLRRRVNSFKNVFSGPIVTHCSAGVGRTGTYICIDAMIESLEAEGRVDIYGYVAKLRRQRCLMVQVEAQYVLIHTALIEYNQFGETEISLSDFHSAVNTLRQKEGNEPSLMEMEFQKLPKFKKWRTTNTASTEENKKKNRYSSLIPYDFNRVLVKLEEDDSHASDAEEDEDYSSDEEDETPTKYVNASYIDGYWSPRGLIAAQGPLPDTVADFLQMLYQHRVKVVVMLSDCSENGQEFCAQYWKDEKTEFSEMVVEVKETETFPTYIRRSLEIRHTKRKESHTTEQYHFLKWAGNELPANPCELIDMMRSIRQNAGCKNRSVPVVAHCNDGSSRSGIFCALWNILESADTEKLVDVFQVVKSLRKERPGMFSNFEQYEFVYAALEKAFPVQNGEVKKATTSPDTVQVINEETPLIGDTSEDQVGAASEQQTEQKTDAVASGVSESTESSSPSNPSDSSDQPEKTPSESTTNGPTVTVEV